LENILVFGPIQWYHGDDIIIFWCYFQGTPYHSSSNFISRGVSSHCTQCLFVVVFMPPRHMMINQRWGGDHIGHRQVHHFSYDLVSLFFDVIYMEVRKVFNFLENKEVQDHRYLFDS